MKYAVAVSAALLATVGAAAPDEMKMTCKNPFRVYLVRFNPTARSLFADNTKYRVLAVEQAPGKLVIAGLTARYGPTFRAEFQPGRKMELFNGNKRFQTDRCR